MSCPRCSTRCRASARPNSLGAAGGGQAGELAPQGLDLRGAVEAEHAARASRVVLLERLGPLDAQQRHEQQRQQRRAQPVEGRADARRRPCARSSKTPLSTSSGDGAAARRRRARRARRAKSGAASSSSPRQASRRSQVRSLGSRSRLIGTGSIRRPRSRLSRGSPAAVLPPGDFATASSPIDGADGHRRLRLPAPLRRHRGNASCSLLGGASTVRPACGSPSR